MVDLNPQLENPEFDNSEFEQDLRRALAPRNPPSDFTDRVMRQIPDPAHLDPQPAQPRRARIFAFPPALRLAAVASLLIAVLAGSLAWQQHQRHVEGERARRQVFTALQITHATLRQVAENISTIQNRKELHP